MEYHSGGSLPLLGRPRYCPGANANGGYLCETGHCCGETGCCTYYYELWWFWLLWTVLILFSCCCAYRHRRAKLRVQQQQRQREISLLAYHGANSYPSSMLDLSFLASLKLPSYEEVAAQPSTPPPPYSSVFTTPRYPQPPRTADPHLLTQHDPLLHRPLSDGPSSLSSDNSSSCSCDSCCPSSPCSSSLSAPVTYETDTSHATTPSEAAPLTLDVTMETITAVATCLEADERRFVSERMVASVAIDIGDEDAAKAEETVATDSSVPNKAVTVAVVTRVASPQPLPSPGSEVALPVVTPSPTKQQLDLAPSTPIVSTGSPVTLPSPSGLDTTLPLIQVMSTEGQAEGPETTPAPKITSMSGPSTPTASTSDSTKTLKTLDLTGSFDTANVPSSPTSVPTPDVGRTLALITGSAGLASPDPNPSLVPVPAPSNLTQAPVLANSTQVLETVPTNLIPLPVPVPSDLTHFPEAVPSNHTQAPVPVPSNHNQVLEPVLTNLSTPPVPVSSNLTQVPFHVPSNLTQDPEPVPSNTTQSPEPLPTDLNPLLGPILTDLTQASNSVSSTITLVPNLQPKIPIVPDSETSLILKPAHSNLVLATDAATLAHCQIPELSPGLGQAPVPQSPTSSLPQNPGSVTLLVSCPDSASVPAKTGPSLVLSQSSESELTRPLPTNVQVGTGSDQLSAPAPVLTLPTPVSSPSSCPAITIESESSFTPSPPAALSQSSPPSLPSPPSLATPPPTSSTSLQAPALLLDPLTAMHQSNKGGSSSGHASSLSPSPRATQSPPKQTLFSPCVDVFEPGPPSWDDGDEEQDDEDNDDDEDEDMGADESQYRHRRLTGDSGIEVCRCRVEEEDDEEEEEEKEEDKRDKKGGGNTDLHDSVDCPARGQITTGEGLMLCNSTSTTTPTSEDGSEVVIVMETV
ncbi:flocculation protein FLO11-like [Plectropomus leopardus]|uniref:flocculation protein FLO11-like n=1 Tax=Plectropomus leopardus TaxID=160734 RepID=UPI001C4C4E26|nr:flocculation protein FLO11-like [Plectropomus leopardus]